MLDIKLRYVNLYELLNCLTDATDLVSHKLANHHQEVAFIAFQIAAHMGLSLKEQQDVVLAGLLHDIGATSVSERLELIDNEPPSVNDHATKGAQMLKGLPYLKNVSNIIRYHHVPWENGAGISFMDKDVPLLSNIIYLADRAVLMLNKDEEIISQIPIIQNEILRHKNIKFNPIVTDAFMQISSKEYIWLDISYKRLYSAMKKILMFDTLVLKIDEVVELTKIFANVIDARSPFTANHSAGVAKTAQKLAQIVGLSENECKMMLIAGYVHDLGKLVVDNGILNKNDKLNKHEYNIIKSHTYYTYRLLQTISGWETINEWASFHHERLNGSGYPFHLTGKDLSLGSRIMAVADVFTAITEDRPYRKGMKKEEAVNVIKNMVSSGSLCHLVSSVLLDSYDEINKIRSKAQTDDKRNRSEKLAN